MAEKNLWQTTEEQCNKLGESIEKTGLKGISFKWFDLHKSDYNKGECILLIDGVSNFVINAKNSSFNDVTFYKTVFINGIGIINSDIDTLDLYSSFTDNLKINGGDVRKLDMGFRARIEKANVSQSYIDSLHFENYSKVSSLKKDLTSKVNFEEEPSIIIEK